MAEQPIDPKQQHLDDHYGDVGFQLKSKKSKDDTGEGLSSKEAGAFLRALRPVVRVGQTLAQAAKKAKPSS